MKAGRSNFPIAKFQSFPPTFNNPTFHPRKLQAHLHKCGPFTALKRSKDHETNLNNKQQKKLIMSQQSLYKSVLVVGATGNVGSFVTRALLSQKANVSILVRKESESKASQLKDLGARIVYGDVTSSTEEELVRALRGIDVIVSTLAGSPEIVYNGQVKLLEAAKKSGVKKFIPTAFGVDFDKTPFGDVLINDPKKKFTNDLAKSGLEYVQIHTGILASYAASPTFLFTYDKNTNTVRYDGDVNVPLEVTALEDVGRFTAEAALRHDIKKHDINVKGDTLTIKEIAQLVYGDKVVLQQGRTTEQLKKSIDDRLQKGVPPQEFSSFIIDQLRWVVITQRGRPTHVDNQLFPNIHPRTFKEFLTAQTSH